MAAAPANGDTRDALYWETVGKLEHGEQWAKENSGEQRKNAQANAQYREGIYTQNEPKTYGANRYRAIREGVAGSGVNSERRGGIAADYANKRFAVQQNLKQTEARLTTAERQRAERTAEGKANAGTQALERAKRQAELNPVVPPTQAYNPGGERTITGPPGPGGVVPYEESSPAGHVRVGAAPAIKWSRDPAIRRIQAQRGY